MTHVKTIDVAVAAVAAVAPVFLWSAAVSHNFQACQSKKMDSSERARPSKYAGHAQRASEAASEFPSLLTVRNATANASPDTERLHMFAYSIVLLTYCPYFHPTNLGLFIFKKE